MKRLFKNLSIITLIVFGITALVFAGESKYKVKPDLQSNYQVEIKIVYNSVSAEKAKALTNKIINEHDKSCKINIQTKKIDSLDASSNTLTWSAGTGNLEGYSAGNCIDAATGKIVPCDE